MKQFFSLAAFLLSTSLVAESVDSKNFEIGSISIIETTGMKNVPGYTGIPSTEKPSPIETTGKVIQLGKDIVALGEAFYELVNKSKPTNTTNFTAISVVPKDPMTKEIVSPFDLEGFSLPVQRSYTAIVKNAAGKMVVKFDYQVVYAYGGSYDGKGKYLTSVMIVPKQVETSWGWEFNATMKLDAIMNHGTKAEPVVGAMVTIKYQMNGFSRSFERNDTIHLTGAGELKSFGIR